MTYSVPEPEAETFIRPSPGHMSSSRSFIRLREYLRLSLVLNAVLFAAFIWVSYRAQHMELDVASDIYSPVQSVIRHQNVLFTSGFNQGRTAYMGVPTPEREALWDDLYGWRCRELRYIQLHDYADATVGTSIISRDEAARLVNKTVPIPNDDGVYDGKYVVMLGVFHQLHCVNLLRKSLYWNKTWDNNTDDSMTLPHLEHCVDALRQAVMCSADVTPHPWIWEDGQNREVADIVHSCRNFDAIREWARPRDVFRHGWNKSIQVPDPLNTP